MKLQQISLIVLMTSTTTFSQTPKKSETVLINGAKVYYEVYGNGTPLFFLHGFTHSSSSWLPYLNDYINEFEVYLIDLKGHGKSSPFAETLSIRSAAQDVDGLVRHLKIDSINAIGYSYGGDVLFQLALLRPGLIKSMVVVGACGICNIKDFPKWIDFLSYKNIDQLPWMREVHQSEEQIKSILAQLPNYNVTVSEAEFKSITSRVLLVIGDGEDSILWDDILKAKNNLPNVSLWVVPETGHRAHRDKNKSDFIRISREFLNQTPSTRQINASKADMWLLRKAVQAVNDRDFTILATYLTDNFQRHDLTSAFSDSEVGSGAGINFVQTLLKAFPDIVFNIQDIFSENDRAVIRFQFTGTHEGDLFGIAPTGKKIDFNGVNIYRFESGKIAEVWQVWDWGGVLKQIGVLDIDKFRQKYNGR